MDTEELLRLILVELAKQSETLKALARSVEAISRVVEKRAGP